MTGYVKSPAYPGYPQYAYSLVDDIRHVGSYGSDAKPGGVDSAADVSPETVNAIRTAHGRLIPKRIGFALIVAGAVVVPAIAFRIPGRPHLAVGVLSGAGSSIAFLSIVLGLTANDPANAWKALLVGVLFACTSVGVLLRVPYFDFLVLTGASLLGFVVWVWSNMIVS